ncbi:hypothetical protein RJ639_045593 [Escallonia herrerae]|uniref:Thioester reductase (TE) domain-containing protein n=1 Tax=Escallonia herrerae TaxID=1293975 RepID=A0AA89B0N1_9ASTE|nr:hypothetical protein RJ639_045593 [Escallonia herrerae]
MEAKSSDVDREKAAVCVLDASTYVGFWILKGLLARGYTVHAAIQENGETDIVKKVRDLERTEKRLMDKMVDFEVRGAINVVEACAQTGSIEKIVFSSSLSAAIWKENISEEKDVDEKSWSDQDFCRRMKGLNQLWYALSKTLSEQAAWALAMDRTLNMVSINAGLVVGPGVAQQSPGVTMSYLKGAAEMYENGVLALVDVNFLADVHIRAYENQSTCGRYFCFDQIVNTEEEALKLAQSLSPLIHIPRYECQGTEVHAERLRNEKLNKLVEGTAC